MGFMQKHFNFVEFRMAKFFKVAKVVLQEWQSKNYDQNLAIRWGQKKQYTEF